MDINLTNEHTPRFRMLCVGHWGVGKSALINRVFGVEYGFTPGGETPIDQEFVPHENQFIVLHDSNRFEPGDDTSFDHAARFLIERRRKPLLKDRLHAIWLCVETPQAGDQALEEGDKKLLALAHELDTPVIIVFTKYDVINMMELSKLLEEEDEEGEGLDEETLRKTGRINASNAFATTVDKTMAALKIPAPPYINVSVSRGYEDSIVTLVKMTGKLVHERLKGDAWVAWAAAQQVDIPIPAVIIL